MKKPGIFAKLLISFGVTLSVIMIGLIIAISIVTGIILNSKVKTQIAQMSNFVTAVQTTYSADSEEYGEAIIRELRLRIYASPDVEAVIVRGSQGEILQNINFDYSLKREEVNVLLDEVLENRSKYFSDTALFTSTKYANYVTAVIELGTHESYKDCFAVVYSDLTQYDIAVAVAESVIRNTMLIAILIMLIAVFLISNSITRSVKKLSGFAKELGRGSFKTREYNFSVREFNELSESMNNTAERLEESDRAQKQFFQNVSHELRTPLMSIQGYAEGIQLGVFSDNTEAASVIVEESKRLTSMLEQVLYISKLDANNLNFSDCDLCDVLRSSKEKLDGLIVGTSKELYLTLPEENVTVTGDPDALLRLFINVISNAIRYSKKRVDVCLFVEGDRISVTVTDDGCGISNEDMTHIFDRFYKGSGGKHGIGLSIAKGIMEAHGGEIIAENTENGAKFTMIFHK